MVQGLPLRFAIFINGATPPCVMPLIRGQPAPEDGPLEDFEEAADLFKVLKPNYADNPTV